jgi:pilus assembly protein CpaF
LVSVAEQKTIRGRRSPPRRALDSSSSAAAASRDAPPPPFPRRRCRRPSRRPRRPSDARRSDTYYQVKATIFGALIEAIDLAQLAKLDGESAREEIRDIVNEIIAIKNIVMSIAEQEELLDDICNDVLGYGPLEPLLSRDDISDIMVNGAGTVFIEVAGKIQRTGIRFRDNQQLLNICQRIVSQVGRRVDESSPICDARLADGSRVNAIVPPLAIDGPALTIRKFKKDKLTLDQLVKFGAITPEGAEILQIIGRCRANVLISGGTGSGKTTLLNCLTNYIDDDERIITCEDAAELQLQQPHVVRLETRPPNIEGRRPGHHARTGPQLPAYAPERIIVGEVRGPEAFDLLAGDEHRSRRIDGDAARQQSPRSPVALRIDDHDGRVFAAVANHPRDDLRLDRRRHPGRPPARRLAPHHPHHRGDGHGRRRTIITQDLFVYDMVGEDANGNIIGRHRSTGIGRPRFWDRARYYGEEKRLAAALDAAEVTVEAKERGHEDASARTGLSRRHRHRRRGMGFHLSAAVRERKGRASPGIGRKIGAGRTPGRQEPALAPRTGRRIAEGSRGAPPRKRRSR